jgi:hypothetical protein
MKRPDSYAKIANGSKKTMNRLLCAAVVDRKFRDLLLANPKNAVRAGYNGERFELDEAEITLVAEIQAKNLSEFAARVSEILESEEGPG